MDEQNAHTEATKLPSPLEFRKDSEEENRDSEKDEDTKELEAVTCECLLCSSPRLLMLGSVLVHLHSRPVSKCVVSSKSTIYFQVASFSALSQKRQHISLALKVISTEMRAGTRQAFKGCHLVVMLRSGPDDQTCS